MSKCAGLVESRNTSGDRKTRRLTDKVLDKSCLSIKKFLEQESEEDPRLLKTSHEQVKYISPISRDSSKERDSSPGVKQFISPTIALMKVDKQDND